MAKEFGPITSLHLLPVYESKLLPGVALVGDWLNSGNFLFGAPQGPEALTYPPTKPSCERCRGAGRVPSVAGSMLCPGCCP